VNKSLGRTVASCLVRAGDDDIGLWSISRSRRVAHVPDAHGAQMGTATPRARSRPGNLGTYLVSASLSLSVRGTRWRGTFPSLVGAAN
jgi:hypothetical protein